MKKILITAFMPFNNQKQNSSLEVIKKIKNDNIKTKILPVEYKKEIYENLLLTERPDVLLLCGQAGGRSKITLEQIAINFMYSQEADNRGIRKSGEKIIENGREAFFATIPTLKIIEKVKDKNLPIELSLSAGGYVCNMSFYASLYYAKMHKLQTKIGFIHFPFYDGQDVRSDKVVPLEVQVQSLKEIIKIFS